MAIIENTNGNFFLNRNQSSNYFERVNQNQRTYGSHTYGNEVSRDPRMKHKKERESEGNKRFKSNGDSSNKQ